MTPLPPGAPIPKDAPFFVYIGQFRILDHETPRQRWKREQSAKRYERRFGKPREVFKGEIGHFDGFRIIKDAP